MLQEVVASQYDLIVIGGGILGAGIARDAAERGLSVALLEQGDFGGGTTAATSKLIHGGLRYLQFLDLPLVRLSLQERRILLQQMPHLVKPLPLLLPCYASLTPPSWQMRLGLTLYDRLASTPQLPDHENLDVKACFKHLPHLNSSSLKKGFLYYDAQVIFPERLCLAIVMTAGRLGADVRNYHRVEHFLMSEDAVEGVAVRNVLTGGTEEFRGRLVVNASGPWHNALMSGVIGAPAQAELVKGSHLIVESDHLPSVGAYGPSPSDGRPIFFTPWRGMMLVGTTEVSHQGSPSGISPSPEEAAYLQEALRFLFPHWPYRVAYGFSGVRALPAGDRSAHQRSRHHRLVHHDRMGGPRNLLSVIGGKMTTFRASAEEVVNQVTRRLGKSAPGRTALHPPDGAVRVNVEAYIDHLAESYATTGLERGQVEYLVTLHGTRAEKILDLALAEPSLRTRLCPHQPDMAAQIRLCREEHVHTLQDFLWRRTGIGGRACLGRDCAPRIATLLGKELGWSAEEERRQSDRYLKALETERIVDAQAPSPA